MTLVIDRDKINSLNASRKADRETLAALFTSLAETLDAAVERRDTGINPGYHGKGIDLHFILNGVGAMLSIDNLHGGSSALVSWFNTKYPPRNFSARFALCVGDGGSMRGGRTHHKATSCGADWYSLAMFLDSGLVLAFRGEAFEQSPIP